MAVTIYYGENHKALILHQKGTCDDDISRGNSLNAQNPIRLLQLVDNE